MSIKVMTLVWANAKVSGSELLILLAMADFSNDEGGDIFPSMQTLAAKSRLSEPQARRVVKNLVAAGYIEIVEQGGWDGKRNRSNAYRISLEMIGGINLIPPPSRERDHRGREDDPTVVSPARDDPSYNRKPQPPSRKVRPTGRKSYNPADYPDL